MAVAYHLGSFPPKQLDWEPLIPLLGPANAAVARFEGVLAGIPNPNVLLSPLTTREAVLSSRIEGTQATLGEVLEYEAQGALDDESTPKKADAREVLNYRAALNEATRLMEELPLSQRLVKATHRVLMDGVRGRNKDPGEYRRIPNWIGPEGCTIDQARFVPCGADALEGCMDAWETYIHADAPDRLVQLAIVHAEFEAIHPFLDGNGRLGRLIIPLFLFTHGLLSRPNFYLSEFLEANRGEYYDRLLAISRDGDWTGWCAFFPSRCDSPRRKSKQQARRWRFWPSIGSGGIGSLRRRARSMLCGPSIGCSFDRSSRRPISSRRPTFHHRQPGILYAPCGRRGCCVRSFRRPGERRPCWLSRSCLTSLRDARHF